MVFYECGDYVVGQCVWLIEGVYCELDFVVVFVLVYVEGFFVVYDGVVDGVQYEVDVLCFFGD